MAENFLDYQQSEKIEKLAAALASAQKAFPAIPKNGKGVYGPYMLLDDILVMTKEALDQNHLVLTQFPLSVAHPGFTEVGVKTLLIHSVSGQFIASSLTTKTVKPGPQDVGSVITYFRRYMAGSILGLAAETDDDGEHATKPGDKREEQTRPAGASPSAAHPKNHEQGNHRSDRAPHPSQHGDSAKSETTIRPNPAKAGEAISEKQGKRLFAICNSKGWTQQELKQCLSLGWGIASTKDIPRGAYEEIVKMVETLRPTDALASFMHEQQKIAETTPHQSMFGDAPPFTDSDIPFMRKYHP